jgi:hypothetical protein
MSRLVRWRNGTRKYSNGKEAHVNKNRSSLLSRAYRFESCPDY